MISNFINIYVSLGGGFAAGATVGLKQG